MLLFNILFPGAYIGQIIIYQFVWPRKGNVWKMKLPSTYTFYNSLSQYCVSLIYLAFEVWIVGWVSFYLILIGVNIGYFFGSAPDHDMYQTN